MPTSLRLSGVGSCGAGPHDAVRHHVLDRPALAAASGRRPRTGWPRRPLPRGSRRGTRRPQRHRPRSMRYLIARRVRPVPGWRPAGRASPPAYWSAFGPGDEVAGPVADGDHAGDARGLQGGLVDGARVLDLDPQPGFGGGLDLADVVRPAQPGDEVPGLLGGHRVAQFRLRHPVPRRRPRRWRRRLSSASSPATLRYSSMSVLRFSDRVPKIACMLSPTISTPAAPSALSFFWSALPMSFTPTRSRVMQASRSLMLLRPPKARTSCWANRLAESSLASCTSTCLVLAARVSSS